MKDQALVLCIYGLEGNYVVCMCVVCMCVVCVVCVVCCVMYTAVRNTHHNTHYPGTLPQHTHKLLCLMHADNACMPG